VDPISLLLMAQSAVGAIRAGCQMLSEGKAEIGKFKKQVETGIADAQAIYKEVAGIWGWLAGLFGGSKPTQKVVVPTSAIETKQAEPKRNRRAEPEPELSYEEFQARAVHEICENLKIYFEAMRQLKEHCRELEEEALTTEKVADSAIDRIEMEWQMNQLSGQLKQVMIYGTPAELGLGSMYKEFLAKYDDILEEQEVARELKAKKDRDNRWRLEHRREILIAKLTYAVAVAMGFLQMIGMYFTL
jgi:hypothetical protein